MENRVIKFRAWIKPDDETKGYMLDHIDPNLNYSEAIDTHNENGYLILMQYTGLLDKNGKEIYEGDIVESIDEVLTVFYNTATACFDVEYIGGECEPMYDRVHLESAYEIIGNIYSNPIKTNEK